MRIRTGFKGITFYNVRSDEYYIEFPCYCGGLVRWNIRPRSDKIVNCFPESLLNKKIYPHYVKLKGINL